MTSLEEGVNQIIDKTRFRTFNKVRAVVRKDYPDITDKELRFIISKRNHDIRPGRIRNKIYQVKIFSRSRNSWFGDLYDNLEGNEPRYWYLFINTNTRYAVAYELPDKSKDSIHQVLRRFVNEYHPRKLTHDEEKGLTADINTEYLKDHKCALFIVQEQLHSTLGIIDRFIRTLRDMNRPVEKPITDKSTDRQFKYISRGKMRKILDSYNNTVHSSTGHTPKEMMDHPELEDQYIQRRLDQQINQYAIKDFKLDIGTKVRYLLPRTAFEKKRYNVSRETYTVTDRLGNMYTIMTQDGNTMNLPRWRLIKSNDPKHMGENREY